MTMQFRFAATFFFAALGLVLNAPHAVSATYVYQDTTFNDPDWVASIWTDTSTPAGSYTSGQVTTGGSTYGPNTPDYRETTHNYGPGAILVDHRNITFNWTPASGEYVTDLDFQYDLRHLTGDIAVAAGAARLVMDYSSTSLARSTVVNLKTPSSPMSGHSTPIRLYP